MSTPADSIDALLASARAAISAGKFADAEANCRRMLQLDPNYPEAIHILGFLAHRAGDIGRAVEMIGRAFELEPKNAVYAHNLADLHASAGQLDRAEQLYRRSVSLDPQFVPSLIKLGIVYEQKGDVESAIELYEKAIRLSPQNASAHCNFADALMKLGRLEDAIASYNRAIQFNPNIAEAFCNRGLALAAAGKFRDAANDLIRSLQLNPSMPNASFALGNVLHRLGNFEQACQAWEYSIQLDPNQPVAYANLGLTQMNLGLYGKSEGTFAAGLKLSPQDADLVANHGLLLLTRGEFEQGWKDCDRRWETRAFLNLGPKFVMPRWEGEDLRGKRLLLWHEQGFGDTIQFIRFAEILKAELGVDEIIFACPQPLHRLLRSVRTIDQIVEPAPAAAPVDFHCPLLRLPMLLKTTALTIPSEVPYLSAPAELIEAWKNRLNPFQATRIGIAWSGSPSNSLNHLRSAPAQLFEPVSKIEGVKLFSLQKDSAPPAGVIDLAPHLTDFAETAAAMMNLDLIITIDTSIAHLAGALARPVWTLLQFAPDHRWLIDRTDTPWYPTMRLFRQRTRGDWQDVFARLADELQNR